MAIYSLERYLAVALSLMGSAILLFSCEKKTVVTESPNLETLMTEYSENMSIAMSENGNKSYYFETPLIEGYAMARDPYREFRKGIKITMFEDDSSQSVSATLVANYAIFYEDRKLWEAKGDVKVVPSCTSGMAASPFTAVYWVRFWAWQCSAKSRKSSSPRCWT